MGCHSKVLKLRRCKRGKIDLFVILVKQELGLKVTPEYRFHPQRKWRFDYALLKHKIAIEVEGGIWVKGRHTRSTGFINDMEKYNAAAAMGWTVFRVAPEELYTRKTLSLIEQAIKLNKTLWSTMDGNQ